MSFNQLKSNGVRSFVRKIGEINEILFYYKMGSDLYKYIYNWMYSVMIVNSGCIKWIDFFESGKCKIWILNGRSFLHSKAESFKGNGGVGIFAEIRTYCNQQKGIISEISRTCTKYPTHKLPPFSNRNGKSQSRQCTNGIEINQTIQYKTNMTNKK